MENVNYKILNPGGNKTALVIGNNYNFKERKIINEKILRDNPIVEQVGFISESKRRLEMAGGEFCMNATRCAIWEYLNGEEGKIELEVSGLREKIVGGITKQKQVYFTMNIGKQIEEIIEVNGIFNFIKLDGILIAVVNEINSEEYIENLRKDEEKTKLKLKNIMKTFNTKENAVGIILLEKSNGKTKINPIIWVKTLDTLYYETACGTGSLATAIYKNYKQDINELDVLQPSGYSISIKLNENNGYVKNAIVRGSIVEERL